MIIDLKKGKGRGLLRSLILMAAVLGTAVPVQGQSVIANVTNNGTYYFLTHGDDGLTVSNSVETSFNPNTCIWNINNSRQIRTANEAGTAYSGNVYLQTGSISLGGSVAWRTAAANNSDLEATRNNYLNRNGTTAWRISNNNNHARTYTVNRTPIDANDNNVIYPTISIASINNSTINFSHNDLSGTFVPGYTRYVFNNSTHNWYNNTDYGSTELSIDANTLSPIYSWSLTDNGGGVATINASTGVVSLSGAPTGNITVRLTVSNISPLNNKTVDFTLTRTSVPEDGSNVTVITGPTISPNSVALHYNEGSQVFTSTATAANTTTTVPAHITLTGGGNTYYYYNGNLYSSTDGFSTTTSTPTDVTLAWSLTGDAATYLTSTPATGGASTTVTHTTQSPSDLTATLTVTASATGASDRTATATITAYGPMVPPTITRSGNTISIASSNAGATIHYIIGDGTPTSLSPTYSAPFDLTESPTTIKAIAIRDDHPSQVATETFMIKLAPPEISMSTSGLTSIIIPQGAGISYYYTTDGTEPTTSSNLYSTSVQLSNPSIFKAIAVKTNYLTSDVATADFINEGVTTDGKVVLDDREDHNWSYYQPTSALPDGYPQRLCSPYPRNVKISYYGYGENTLSTSDVAAPAANTFTTNTSASDVKVGIGEDGNTFVYYKTLERDANNRFPYEIIPNPFYVRPKSGDIYTGFYKWRIKSISNGAVYDASTGGTAYGVGAMLDAEATYYFQPTDNAMSNANNATSMTIELEALWAPAEISTGATPSFGKGYNSVERNFYVGAGGLFSSTTPCTYSSFYPNGTTNGTTAATVTNGTVNNRQTKASGAAQADSKVEYMLLTGTTNADAHNLTFGRGVGIGTAGTFYPVNASKNVDVNFRLRLESGVFSTLYLMADGTNNTYRRFQNHFTFGSDYDRAKGDNSKLTVAQGGVIKNGNSEFSQANQDKPTLTCIIKSGEYQSSYWNNNNNAQYNYGFYCCQDHDNASYPGLVSLTVEGGHFASIIGGRGNYTVGCITQDSLAFTLRFKGGLVENSVYGASSNNATYGSRRLIFTGGEVRGWIAAGCNGTSDSDERGQTHGDSYVYVGGNTKVGNAEVPRTNNSAVGGNVYGAGRGGNRQYASIKNSHVAVADNAEVLYDVFGGGFHGHIVTTSNVFVLGGTTHGRVFGGGDNNSNLTGNINRSIPTVNIHMTGGLVEGGVYGGSNENGIVTTLVNMHIDGGQVGVDADHKANVHGGGLGQNTSVSGNVSVTLGASVSATDSATVYGNVYGGSAFGSVNTDGSNTTIVTMNKTLINGNLFGGALGQANPFVAAPVNGLITVNINGGRVNGNVYGGGDVAPYSPSDNYPLVNMTGGQATNVFGGGKGGTATVTGNPKVTLSGKARVTGNVYGGGDAAAVTGQTQVLIED